jgi:hypothetical protein
MGNWLIVERCLGFVVGVEVDCLALFLAVLFERLRYGMLFVKVLEDRRLLVGVYDLGLHVACSCMVGNIAKGIFGILIGNLGEGYGFGRMVGLRMMIAMVGASEICG